MWFDYTNPIWKLFCLLDSIYSRETEKSSSVNVVGTTMHHFTEQPLSFFVAALSGSFKVVDWQDDQSGFIFKKVDLFLLDQEG